MINFYASPEYLEVVAETYFRGRRVSVEDVRIGSDILRLLVVDGRRVVTNVDFLDYHAPLPAAAAAKVTRSFGYAPSVARQIIRAGEWDADRFAGFEPAPFVDWSQFRSFEQYCDFLKARGKGLYKEYERRRRRLVDSVGEIDFRMDDDRPDVLELARQWKSRQLRETGAKNYFRDPRNSEYFARLREKGLLTASTLRAGDRLLSTWMGFVYRDVWSGWVFTYDHDPALRKFSLGHQLLRSMLEESFRQGHREFDFSIGNEDYKWFYATHARILGPIGRAPLRQRLLVRARDDAKRVLSRYPKLLSMAVALKRKLR